MRKFLKPVLAISMASAAPMAANAAVITSLPGGTALPIPVLNVTFTSLPHTLAPGIVASPSSTFSPGYTFAYSFGPNGVWNPLGNGISLIGLDLPTGFFDIDFAAPIQAFLGDINWTRSPFAPNASIAAFGASGLLESLTLESGGNNLVTPGFYGFSRSTAEITKIRFSNEYVGIRNLSFMPGVTNAVPEPATWAMMIFGFGFVGAAMRRRRAEVRVAFA